VSNANDMAFPVVLESTRTPNDSEQLGLTKRELAAIEIMARVVGSDWTNESYYQDLARRSVLAADALLAELAK
jgi:hypothetical protein